MVVAKLQKKEAGAPMRQPGIIENISLGVTEEERKQMMAKYYRRQVFFIYIILGRDEKASRR